MCSSGITSMRHSSSFEGLSGALACWRARLGHVRAMTFLATLLEQRLAARGLVTVDGAEDFLRPARRAQQLQRVLDAHQAARCPPNCDNARPAASARASRSHQRRDGADAQRLADVARQWLRHRAVVLHPVELPDVPQVRVADRRVADLVVSRGQVIAERGVADAAERIGAPEALVHRVQLAQRIVLAAARASP